jgi:hypothetical protein
MKSWPIVAVPKTKLYHFSDRDGVSLITEDYHNIGVPTPNDSNRDGDFRAH